MSNDEELQQELMELIDEMPLERHRTAYQRACKKMGLETWYEGDTLCVDSDEPDSDELLDAYAQELNKMVFEDTMLGLKEAGLVEAQVEEHGELGFYLTDEGEKVAKEILEEDS